MRDRSNAGPKHENGQQRMDEIREVSRRAIPQLAALLHNVPHKSGMYSNAIELAQIVVDESLKLYEEFGAEELGAFLTRIADSSVCYADESVKGGVNRPYKGALSQEIAEDK